MRSFINHLGSFSMGSFMLITTVACSHSRFATHQQSLAPVAVMDQFSVNEVPKEIRLSPSGYKEGVIPQKLQVISATAQKLCVKDDRGSTFCQNPTDVEDSPINLTSGSVNCLAVPPGEENDHDCEVDGDDSHRCSFDGNKDFVCDPSVALTASASALETSPELNTTGL